MKRVFGAVFLVVLTVLVLTPTTSPGAERYFKNNTT